MKRSLAEPSIDPAELEEISRLERVFAKKRSNQEWNEMDAK